MPTVKSSTGLLSSIDLHYTDTGGEGRPVVLIHGWPLSGASWSEQIPALTAAGLRVITYDRRGFGDSDKPGKDYDYDAFADDLKAVLEGLDLTDVSLVGFSMGGGEIARYIGRHGQDRVRNVVFASAVPPYLLKTDENPDGGLGDADVNGMQEGLRADRDGFFDQFLTAFFSAGDELKVTEAQRQEALALAAKSEQTAAVDCIAAFGRTDFREDLTKVTVPTLVIHGDSDGTVPFEVSGQRTAAAITGSKVVVIADGPHGVNVSHPAEFNAAVVDFITS